MSESDAEKPVKNAASASSRPARPRRENGNGETGTTKVARKAASKSDSLKIVMILVCAVLLLACIGVGAFLLFNPQEESKPERIEKNFSQEFKTAFAKGQKLYKAGAAKAEAGDIEAGMKEMEEGIAIWDQTASRIERMRASEKFGGPEFAGYDLDANTMRTSVQTGRGELFKYENQLRMIKRKAEQAAAGNSGNKPEPTAPAKADSEKSEAELLDSIAE